MIASETLITQTQIDEFRANGFVILRGFYDVDAEVLPIQQALRGIIGLLREKAGITSAQTPFSSDRFDDGYQELLAIDRTYGSAAYDAAKLVPAFIRLLSCDKNEQLFRLLRATDLAGIGAASFGIRIDNPGEEKFRSHWHQEFLFQPQSLDGLVFWSPLVDLIPEMGPVQICSASHHGGLCRYRRGAQYGDKLGAYQIGLDDEAGTVAQYQVVAPLLKAGDLLIMDYLTLHQSGYNMSARSRWSMQFRLFNFRDPVGRKLGWRPSVTAGTDIEALFPDRFAR